MSPFAAAAVIYGWRKHFRAADTKEEARVPVNLILSEKCIEPKRRTGAETSSCKMGGKGLSECLTERPLLPIDLFRRNGAGFGPDGQRRGGGRGASERRRNERMSAKLGAPFQDGKLWEAARARGGRYLVEVDGR